MALGWGTGVDIMISIYQRMVLVMKKIGIAFSFQEVEEIPVEDHDERLDWILTEKHLYKVQ